MSKLLINESPLQVLPTLAIRLGLNEAIFLQQLHWLTKDKPAGPDGLQWLRRTYPEWQAQTFPFWSTKTIERTAKALAKTGIIKIEQRDKSCRNRDNFYAIDRERYAAWEAGLTESSVSIEGDNLSASEPDNLSPSEADNLADSYNDQNLKSNNKEKEKIEIGSTPRRRSAPYPKRQTWPRYISLFFGVTNMAPMQQLWPDIERALGENPDPGRLRKCYVEWLRRGYRNNALGWLDWYEHNDIPPQRGDNGRRNQHYPNAIPQSGINPNPGAPRKKIFREKPHD